MPEGTRVLVVEDDPRVAASVRRALEYAGHAVEVVGDGPTALATALREPPDVVVLDVTLPGLDGLAVCRALRAAATARPMVLMLTARDATADRVAGLDAGADDYLVKPFAYEELLARVRALLRRRPEPAASGARLAFAGVVLDPATREVWYGDQPVVLTALEFDLLHHFLQHPRQVLSRQQLLDAVWGGGNSATTNVVDVYIGYLRTKLGEPRLVHTVRGVGYALRTP